MIFDSFIFYNEFDIAELRIKELWDVVDKFVIVEMPITFSGRNKPLLFAQRFERFRPYKDKIIYVPILSGWPEGNNPWLRESFQRDKQSSFHFSDDDIITVSDCDEVPHPSIYSRFDPASGIASLEQMFFHYWIDVVLMIPSPVYKMAKICTGKMLREMGVEKIRSANDNFQVQMLSGGGWHFSYIGDAEFIRNKVSSFSHCHEVGAKAMVADPDVNRGLDLLKNKVTKVEINGAWPKTILDNMDYWKKYLCDR